MRMHHVVVCGLVGFTKFLYIISLTAGISKKKNIENKMFILIFPATIV